MQIPNLKALSLLSKYGTLKTADLTVEILQDIATALAFDLTVDDKVLGLVTSLLRENDIDGLADLLGKPEILAKMTQFFTGEQEPPAREVIRVCNHCGNFNVFEV